MSFCFLSDSDKSSCFLHTHWADPNYNPSYQKIKFLVLKIKMEHCINVNLSLMGYQSKMKLNLKKDKRDTFRD